MNGAKQSVALQVLRTFKERLLSGFVWNLVSTVTMQGSVLITGVILARVVSFEAFGVYAVLTTTVMTAASVAQGAVGLTSAKFVGEWLHGQPMRVARLLRICAVFTMTMGVVAATLLIVLSSFIAQDVLGKPQVTTHLRWVAVAVMFHVMVTFQYGALQGFGAFRAISRAASASGGAHLLLSCLGAWKGGLDGAVIAFAISAFLRWWFFRQALHHIAALHKIPPATKTEPEDWRLLWTFALPASLPGFLTLPCMWGVMALVARQPDGLAWVALFAVAHQLRQMVLQLPTVLNTVSFSVLSRLKGQGTIKEFWKVFWTNMGISLGISTLLVATLSWLSEPVLMLYGSSFVEGRSLLLILMLSVLPEIAGLTAYQLVQSAGRMWRSLFFIVGPRDLAYLGLAAILIPTYGLVGAGGAYALAQLYSCMATVAVVRGFAPTRAASAASI